jgi:hypothetical protein
MLSEKLVDFGRDMRNVVEAIAGQCGGRRPDGNQGHYGYRAYSAPKHDRSPNGPPENGAVLQAGSRQTRRRECIGAF